MSAEMNDEYLAGRDIRYLGDMQRLQLDPGDVIVVSCDVLLTHETMARIHSYVEQRLKGHTVLVLGKGMHIGVMGKQGKPNGTN